MIWQNSMTRGSGQYVEVTDAVAPEGVDVLDGAFHEVQAELLGFGEGRFDIRRIQREVVDGVRFIGVVHGPHLEGQVVQAQEGAAVLTVGIDAEAFEAETLVVGDGAFEVRGRNADMAGRPVTVSRMDMVTPLNKMALPV